MAAIASFFCTYLSARVATFMFYFVSVADFLEMSDYRTGILELHRQGDR